MKNIHTVFIIIFYFISNSFVNAQFISKELISTSGDHFETSYAEISWSIGETIIEEFSDSLSILNQGFHQGDKMKNESQEKTTYINNFNLSIAPNPAFNEIYIRYDFAPNSHYLLLDYIGKIKIKKVLSNKNYNRIDLESQPSGLYYVIVEGNGKREIKKLVILN